MQGKTDKRAPFPLPIFPKPNTETITCNVTCERGEKNKDYEMNS